MRVLCAMYDLDWDRVVSRREHSSSDMTEIEVGRDCFGWKPFRAENIVDLYLIFRRDAITAGRKRTRMGIIGKGATGTRLGDLRS